MKSLPQQLVLISAFFLAFGAFAAAAWGITGDVSWVRAYFDYPATIFFLFTCLVEVKMAWISWSAFQDGEPLELGWFLLMMASLTRFAGTIIAQVAVPLLRPDSFIDRGSLREMGLVLSGPLMLILLGAGLFQALRVYRRVGLLARPQPTDYIWIVLSVLWLFHQTHEVITYLPEVSRRANVFSVIKMVSDPLLSVLLIEAIILLRSAQKLGGGWIARCWGTYAVAVVLTSLGDVGIWAEAWGHIPYPYSAITWYVWLPAAAAFAIAPAYQACAVSRAWEFGSEPVHAAVTAKS